MLGCRSWESADRLCVQEQHAEPERAGRAQQRAARPESLTAYRESATTAAKVSSKHESSIHGLDIGAHGRGAMLYTYNFCVWDLLDKSVISIHHTV